MGMMICGVAACQTLDSSGEVLDIHGLDISTLERDGVFNYEHEEKLADQIVGKIRMAKKIFSADDCSTEQELDHWRRIEVPFLWVVGELFDDLGHMGAQNVAAMLRYDERERNERGGYPDGMKPVVNMSIQGGKLNKTGAVVDRSLARKVSITITPCNKVAEAEEYRPTDITSENKKSSKITDMRAFIGSMLKAEDIQVAPLHKADDAQARMNASMKPREQGLQHEKYGKEVADAVGTNKPLVKAEGPKPLGQTTTGKQVHAVGHHSNYSQGFTAPEHREAANMHFNAAQATADVKTKQHHMRQSQFHSAIAGNKEKGPPKGASWSSRRAVAGADTQKVQASVHRPYAKVDNLKKAIDAGSPAGAPSTLSGGAALQKEDMDQKLHKAEQEASAALSTWNRADEFRKFLAERKPDMTPVEREAFAKVFALFRVRPQKNRLK